MLNNLGDRKVRDVIEELRDMNAATAELSGLKEDGTPVFAVIFVQGEPTTGEILELLEDYSADDYEEEMRLEGELIRAAVELAEVPEDEPETRALRLEKLQAAVADRADFLERKRRAKALEEQPRWNDEEDE